MLRGVGQVDVAGLLIEIGGTDEENYKVNLKVRQVHLANNDYKSTIEGRESNPSEVDVIRKKEIT